MRQSLVYACIETTRETITSKCRYPHQALRYRSAEMATTAEQAGDEVIEEDAYSAPPKLR